MISKRYLVFLFVLIAILEFFVFKTYKRVNNTFDFNTLKNSTTQVFDQEVKKPEYILPSKEIPKTYITSTSQIFENIEANIQPEKSADGITIISTGDVMLGRAVNVKTHQYKDFTWAFKNIATTLKEKDVAIINLENPLFENCPQKNDGMIFCASDKHIEGLQSAGIDIASISNNHSFNYGQKGVDKTQEILNKNNILPVGMNNPHYFTKGDFKIALLGYNQIECTQVRPDCIDVEKNNDSDLKVGVLPASIKKDIATAKQNSDFVILLFHWGEEYHDKPTDFQRELAKTSIDNGADMILGNHPHWIQPLEIYKDKLIVYSHGNTIFDQMWSQKTREGIMVETTIDKKSKKIVNLQIVPTIIEDFGQPQILEKQSEAYKRILNALKLISL